MADVEAQVEAILTDYLATATPQQLHIYAARSNYDGNKAVLQRLIDNPKLDRGTALLIFWYLGADYFARHLEQDVPNFQQPTDHMLRLLEQRYVDGFYVDGNIFYDPADGALTPGEYAMLGPIKRKIHEAMYAPVVGSVTVDTDDEEYDDGLPLVVAEKISALFDESAD